MARPLVLRLRRPYANAEEYLASEAWTLDTRAMLLVDQPELAADTDIAFEVTLADGSKPIRAEAKVIGPVAATANRPGGLRVRFTRYGAATRAFVERAVELRWSAGDPPRPTTPPPPSVAPSQASGARGSVPPPSAQPASTRPGPPTLSDVPARRSEHPSAIPNWEEDKTMRFRRDVSVPAAPAPNVERPSSVPPPPNRDDLLERLRRRAREIEAR